MSTNTDTQTYQPELDVVEVDLKQTPPHYQISVHVLSAHINPDYVIASNLNNQRERK